MMAMTLRNAKAFPNEVKSEGATNLTKFLKTHLANLLKPDAACIGPVASLGCARHFTAQFRLHFGRQFSHTSLISRSRLWYCLKWYWEVDGCPYWKLGKSASEDRAWGDTIGRCWSSNKHVVDGLGGTLGSSPGHGPHAQWPVDV